jgi:hypothetical protein
VENLHDVVALTVQAAHKVGAISEDAYHEAIALIERENPAAARRAAEAEAAQAKAEQEELARLQAKYPQAVVDNEAAERQRLADLQARAADAAARQAAEQQAAAGPAPAAAPGGGFWQGGPASG